MEGKSIDNSLSVTPDINNEPLQLDTDTNEGDCNSSYCTSMSYSLPYIYSLAFYTIYSFEFFFLF